MRIDASEFPIVWLRDGEENDVEDEALMTQILERGDRFVMIAERLPREQDVAAIDHEEKKRRALLFKQYRKTLMRLCAGMLMVQDSTRLSRPLQIFIEGAGKAFGVPFTFVPTAEEALVQARRRLANQ